MTAQAIRHFISPVPAGARPGWACAHYEVHLSGWTWQCASYREAVYLLRRLLRRIVAGRQV